MSDDDVVGHKTFHDGKGGFRHEPLTRGEADALWAAAERRKGERAAKYPTAQDCVNEIFEACYRLEELGWKRTDLAPPDGVIKDTISLGSSGIHKAYCEPRTSPSSERRWWWHPSDDGDLWPHSPIYYKPTEPTHPKIPPRSANGLEPQGGPL